MNQYQFRAHLDEEARVDVEAGVIRGASVATVGEALGRGIRLDATTLENIAELGNASPVKMHFTHGEMFSVDRLAQIVGRASEFRIDGDQVRADLKISRAAEFAPGGNLRAYLLALADEDPEAFGLSIVAGGTLVWVMEDDSERDAEDMTPPEGAVSNLPAFRVDELQAVDFVDEPAANAAGLFSSHPLASASNTKPQKGNTMDLKEFQELLAKHPAHAATLAALPADATKKDAEAALAKAKDDAERVELKSRAEDAEKRVSEVEDELAAAKKERDERIAELEEERDEAKAEAAKFSALGSTGRDPGESQEGGNEAPTIKRSELVSMSREQHELLAAGKLRVVEDD